MTNQEYRDFFIDLGAYPDFEIVSAPLFDIIEVINGRSMIKNLQVSSWDTISRDEMNNFINEMNKLNNKWFIFNDTGSAKPFNYFVSYVRCCNIPSEDRLNKYRRNKIKEIRCKIN